VILIYEYIGLLSIASGRDSLSLKSLNYLGDSGMGEPFMLKFINPMRD
jgi:hypothetical protein